MVAVLVAVGCLAPGLDLCVVVLFAVLVANLVVVLSSAFDEKQLTAKETLHSNMPSGVYAGVITSSQRCTCSKTNLRVATKLVAERIDPYDQLRKIRQVLQVARHVLSLQPFYIKTQSQKSTSMSILHLSRST